jgi:2-succinyl-5-enolpyruvyl-6-hydroxy-3-cyclohexene-1-carboxylate synthase
MIPLNPTYAPIQVLVDELARSGMRHAVTSPGSRNAPISLALAEHPDIEAISVLDERSAGFVALGIAKSTGRPVAVTTTSGTASANLMPPIVEAHEARVPLIALTADRPPELRDVGAGQAIDQIKLFGSFAKWFVEAGNHAPGRATAVHFRALGCRAYGTAMHGRPGPVHVNLPLREPLAPVRDDALEPSDWDGRPDGEPWTRVLDTGGDGPATVDLGARVRAAERVALVCGAAAAPLTEIVPEVAAAHGWPVLADALSGLRCGPHDRSHVVAHYDALLRSDEWAGAHQPDLIIRIGDTPTSKPLRAWLAQSPQIVIDPELRWDDPTRAADLVVPADARGALAGLLDAPADADSSWLEAWRHADAVVPETLAAAPADLIEPAVCFALAGGLGPGTTLWVSSSMPIRDIETFAPSVETPIRFLANRGANGIDGVVSSALGAALAGEGPVIALLGELALLHDVSGVIAAGRARSPLGIVCLNNSGGGIFDFLPVAQHADRDEYEEHIATPVAADLAHVAALGGFDHVVAESAGEAAEQARPGALVEVKSDRETNVRAHRKLFTDVAEALRGLSP